MTGVSILLVEQNVTPRSRSATTPMCREWRAACSRARAKAARRPAAARGLSAEPAVLSAPSPRSSPALRWYVLLIAVAAVAIAAVLSRVCFPFFAFEPDTAAYLFQANSWLRAHSRRRLLPSLAFLRHRTSTSITACGSPNTPSATRSCWRRASFSARRGLCRRSPPG